GALAPASDLLAFLFIDRITAAASLADDHSLALASAPQCLVQGAGGLGGELRRILVLCLAVQRDVHAVMGHFAADFGAQGHLVVVLFVGNGGKAAAAGKASQQCCAAGNGGKHGGSCDRKAPSVRRRDCSPLR